MFQKEGKVVIEEGHLLEEIQYITTWVVFHSVYQDMMWFQILLPALLKGKGHSFFLQARAIDMTIILSLAWTCTFLHNLPP